jgi:hypothetical protein
MTATKVEEATAALVARWPKSRPRPCGRAGAEVASATMHVALTKKRGPDWLAVLCDPRGARPLAAVVHADPSEAIADGLRKFVKGGSAAPTAGRAAADGGE